MTVDNDFVLGKPKNQIMTCDQELTTTMVVGRCFFSEGTNIQVNSIVTHGCSSPKTTLHGGALAFFLKVVKMCKERRVRPRRIMVGGGGEGSVGRMKPG